MQMNTFLLDRNRPRKVVFYGRVSTEHEAQLSALENQMQWYEDIAKRYPNWQVVDKYIDECITGTQAKKRPAFMKMIADAEMKKFDLIVTREVCRFARNTVDTLTHTRALKNLDIEVFFVDDNIWTMDGDGELRLTIMATLAQEESRKVSERVRAGQRISRENKTLYGSGNILGYNRVDGTYVIDEEQAETVRTIFDLYEQGHGTMKIAKILREQGRLTATGTTKWTCSNVSRVLKNATYKGCMPDTVIKYSTDVKAQDLDDVEILKKYVNNNIAKIEGNGTINPYVDGGKGSPREDQQLEVYKEYLKYAENHLLFLPKDMTPEMIMLSDSKVKVDFSINEDDIFSKDKGKEAIKRISVELFDETDSNSIESTYKFLVKHHYKNDTNITSCYDEVEKLLQAVYDFYNKPVKELVSAY